MTGTHRKLAVVGMFDGVHLGHRALLAEAAAEASARGLSPIAVTFSDHPMRVVRPDACPPLIMTPQERFEALRLSPVPDTLILDFDAAMSHLTAREFMTYLRDRHGVDTLVMGYNHRFGSDRLTDPEQYRQAGAELELTVLRGSEFRIDHHKVSSSEIRKALQRGDVLTATAMLGRPYSMAGTVVSGKKLGRTIGFPTANIAPADSHKIVPAPGVYACMAHTPCGDFMAMVNIGHRPTVDSSDSPISIEANLLDFDGNIYGQTVSLDFHERLRDEKRFESVDALARQLRADHDATRAALTRLI